MVPANPCELGLILCKDSWPGISRGIIGNMDRFRSCYFKYKGYYFTGDEGYLDASGNLWVRGRADDVINVSGHRISTAEVESAASQDPNVAEAAVVAIDHEITGQALCFFIVLKDPSTTQDYAEKSLVATLREKIGRLIHPNAIYIVGGIPKTATGKIMRRVLRDLLIGKVPGDLSTCMNKDIISGIKEIIQSK